MNGGCRTKSSSSHITAGIGRQPLQERCQTAVVTMMYCILHKLIGIPSDPYRHPAKSFTRCSSIRYITPYYRTDYLVNTLVLVSNKTVKSTAKLINQLTQRLLNFFLARQYRREGF
ncbi:hypothetical protein DPMN_165359 [Dreissena polymorpha]|uniref:Uncharacterized protein n=1 Tax=Dreissena polymorpha TaxID=45954 RepID=A0A9D4EUN2_DREPO|nr:hypothetical protein DPMN_165359 [Dreissena polymorpha]